MRQIIFYSMPFMLLFSRMIGFYIPASFLPELYAILFYLTNRRSHCSKKEFYALACSGFILIWCSILGNFSPDSFFFNETFRLCTMVAFVVVFVNTTFNERRLLQIILCICKLHILYSIFEFYWLNFHSFGDFDGLITGKVVTQSFDKESGYMNNSGNILFGLPFYRPFGLLIMPQLSGFIFSIGIILQFILHPKEKKSLLWYVLFLATDIMCLAKTAIICNVALLLIIIFRLYVKKSVVIVGISIAAISVATALESTLDFQVLGDLQRDFEAIFNFPAYNWFIGRGFTSVDDYSQHGFTCESYWIRFIAHIGFLFFIVYVVTLKKIFASYSPMLNNIVLVLLVFLDIHYCCTSAPFLLMCTALIIAVCIKHPEWKVNRSEVILNFS